MESENLSSRQVAEDLLADAQKSRLEGELSSARLMYFCAVELLDDEKDMQLKHDTLMQLAYICSELGEGDLADVVARDACALLKDDHLGRITYSIFKETTTAASVA